MSAARRGLCAADVRALALALPDTLEGAHMGHSDFRVAGKIFATLVRDETVAVVMLTPAQQAAVLRRAPAVFTPASGAWGRQGCTEVRLALVSRAGLTEALKNAWHNKAPPG